MLHIVNGDSFAAKLRESGIDGDLLVWRESLYEVPLTVTFTDVDTRASRLRYFVQKGVPEDQFVFFTETQEAALQQYKQQNKAVLWFEHDLFDQTMLIYLLQWFAANLIYPTHLFLLCIDSFPGVHSFKGLGQLTPEQTYSLKDTWVPVSEDMLQLAVRAWRAYASVDPTAIERLLTEDTSALPFLHSAFLCHLQRFPSLRNGLSQVEQLTLEAIHKGMTRPLPLFQYISDAVSEYGLGDVQYWNCLTGLSEGTYPLVNVQGANFPKYSYNETMDWEQWELELTDLGIEVMSGRKDAVQQRGVDCWIGGVHLMGHSDIWRWDRDKNRLLKKTEK